MTTKLADPELLPEDVHGDGTKVRTFISNTDGEEIRAIRTGPSTMKLLTGDWVVVHDRYHIYPDWEFREMFRPALMCGYGQPPRLDTQ